VPIARPDAGSITLAECASPLNVKIRRVAGSYRIASSSGATVVCPSTWSVVRSNIVTLLSAPEVAKPWPVSYANAIPWARSSPGISAATFPVPGSTTITRFWRAMNSRWPTVSSAT